MLVVVFIYVVVLERVTHRRGRYAHARGLGPARPAPVAQRPPGFSSLAPLIYGAMWWGDDGLGDAQPIILFGGQTRFGGGGDISSSRFGIWRNTWSLIASHPWLGVGFGDFNFAWSLTPFPGRPVAFFDHTHNLLLNFAVGFGVPLASSGDRPSWRTRCGER